MGVFKGKKLRYRLHLHMKSGNTAVLPVCEEYNIEYDNQHKRITAISIKGVVEEDGERHALLNTMSLANIEFVEVEYVR